MEAVAGNAGYRASPDGRALRHLPYDRDSDGECQPFCDLLYALWTEVEDTT